MKMLFSKNALLVQILALHLGNSLHTGLGLYLLGGDEQESRVCWVPQHWPNFRSLSYAINYHAVGKSQRWSQMAWTEILVPPLPSCVTWGKFRSSLANTTDLVGLFWHLYESVHIKCWKHTGHAEGALQMLTIQITYPGLDPQPQVSSDWWGRWTGTETFTLQTDKCINEGAKKILMGGMPNLECFLEEVT